MEHNIDNKKADKSDIKELIDIRIKFLKYGFKETIKNNESNIKRELLSYFKEHLNKDFYAYIALNENKIISSAFISISNMPSGVNFINGKIGTILNVFTVKDFRRQGIAKKLIEKLIEDVSYMNLDYIELNSTEEGYRLYNKLGFEEINTDYIKMKYNFNNK